MGASSSSEHDDQTTPPKPDRDHRFLTVDPRSPSCGIDRTPIVVTKTPDGASSVLDPRSPTVGIVRTPLSLGHLLAEGEAVHPLTVPKFDLDQEITSDRDVEQVEPAETQPCAEDLLDCEGELIVSAESQELSELQDLSLDDSPACESTRLVPKVDLENTKTADNTENMKPRKKKKQPKAKELFPSRKTGSYHEVSRSPLSTRTVDMNSPRQMVQRKQIKDVDLKRSCALEHSNVSRFIVKDKENL